MSPGGLGVISEGRGSSRLLESDPVERGPFTYHTDGRLNAAVLIGHFSVYSRQ